MTTEERIAQVLRENRPSGGTVSHPGDWQEWVEETAAEVLAALKSDADKLIRQWADYAKHEPSFDAVIAYDNCAEELARLVSSWGSAGSTE